MYVSKEYDTVYAIYTSAKIFYFSMTHFEVKMDASCAGDFSGTSFSKL